MATSLSFEDRFSYPDPNGPATGTSKSVAQSLSDAEIEALSPPLVEMVQMVRGYSVILQSATTLEIFNTITTDSDPRIALILAAARSREDNKLLFAGLGAVREVMFADSSRPNSTGFTNRSLYSDGIRRVSVALTASRILARLSQISEQAEHSKVIEQQALEDLDRIISTWESSGNSSLNSDSEDEVPGSFYFEPKTMAIPADKQVVVRWQSPALGTGWVDVAIYTGNIETWQIVSSIADSINSAGMGNPDSVLLAAPKLNGPILTTNLHPNSFPYHILDFYPRKPVPGVISYSINIFIDTVLIDGETETEPGEYPLNRSPFCWGTEPDSVNNYNINGSMIIIRYNKLGSARATAEDYNPFVLYARNGVRYVAEDNSPPSTSEIEYRVQPYQPKFANSFDEDDFLLDMTATVKIPFPRLISSDTQEQLDLDNNRFSQFILAVTNSIASLDVEALLTTAIIRNDSLAFSDPMGALELVASIRNMTISGIILDILSVPKDIELSTGDRARPLVNFSNKPRSAIVMTDKSGSNNNLADTIMKKEQTYILPKKRNNLWDSINDEAKNVTSRRYHR